MLSTYDERCKKLAGDSSIMVAVLLGDAPGDMELVAVKPWFACNDGWESLRTQSQWRGLRCVGCVGLVNDEPRVVLEEPISLDAACKLAVQFAVYVSALIEAATTAGLFSAELERAEVMELERLHAVPDSRTTQ